MRLRPLTGLDWFLGAAYHTRLNVSLLRDLVGPVRNALDQAPYSPDAVTATVQAWEMRRKKPTLIADQVDATEVVLSAELHKVAAIATRSELVRQLNERRRYEDFLRSTVHDASRVLSSMGLQLDTTPEIHFTTHFPAPYDESDAAIIACDRGDEMAFGIPPGLYVRTSYRPFYTEFIICHEVIHLYLGEKNPDIFCGRLEEGLAEVLGAGAVALRLMPAELVMNLFIVNRLSSHFAGQWERYLDATRQVWRLTNRLGLEGVLRFTREGRPALQRLEAQIYEQLGGSEEKCSADVPGDLAALMAGVCDLFPRSLVASPAAFLVAPHAAQGATVREIASLSGLSPELSVEALEELQDGLGLVALRPDKSVVSFSVAQSAAASGLLRFDVSMGR